MTIDEATHTKTLSSVADVSHRERAFFRKNDPSASYSYT